MTYHFISTIDTLNFVCYLFARLEISVMGKMQTTIFNYSNCQALFHPPGTILLSVQVLQYLVNNQAGIPG